VVPLAAATWQLRRKKCKGPLSGPTIAKRPSLSGRLTSISSQGRSSNNIKDEPGAVQSSYQMFVASSTRSGWAGTLPMATGNMSTRSMALVTAVRSLRVLIRWLPFQRARRPHRRPEPRLEGKGLWSTYAGRAPYHIEAARATTSKVVQFQLRPDPLRGEHSMPSCPGRAIIYCVRSFACPGETQRDPGFQGQNSRTPQSVAPGSRLSLRLRRRVGRDTSHVSRARSRTNSTGFVRSRCTGIRDAPSKALSTIGYAMSPGPGFPTRMNVSGAPNSGHGMNTHTSCRPPMNCLMLLERFATTRDMSYCCFSQLVSAAD